MKISKNLRFAVLLVFAIGCKKNVSKNDSSNLKDTLKINNSITSSSTNEKKNKIKKSFVISCGSGCAMTYTAENISSEVPAIKVKFKVDMYLDEKLSDTYYEVYIFNYDNLNNILKIQHEGRNENILENLLPDAKDSFRNFSGELIN